MLRHALIIIFCIFSLIILDPALAEERDFTERVVTLNECYSEALHRNEKPQIQRERIIQFEQNYKEALGNIFPRISFQFTERFQDTGGVETGESVFAKTFVRSDSPEAKFILKQTLFSGFMEYAGLSSLKASIEREKFNEANIKRILFLDVARAFYTVVLLDKNLENVQKIIALANERLSELKRRVNLGKSRSTEILAMESQILTLRAQEEKLKGDREKSLELLFFLTGMPSENVRVRDEMEDVEVVPSEEELLSRFLKRPDLQAMRKDVESKRYSLKMEKRSLLPTISLLGDYYLKRVGFQEPIDWDIYITLDVPIFQGGSGIARVKEASSLLREAVFSQSYFLREAEAEIKRMIAGLRSSIAQRRYLKDAFTKMEESYKLYVNEYRLGLVNNLEVIQAMNNMLEAKMNLDSVSIENKLALIELKVTAGELP